MAGISYPKIQMAILVGFEAIMSFSFESISPFINQVSATHDKYWLS
jgi:hypothetical protein